MSNEMKADNGPRTGELARPAEVFTVPRESLLEGFAELHAEERGIDLQQLRVNDAISLYTQNSAYHLVVVNPAELRVTVQGGSYFAVPTAAIVRGSTVGGAMLKTGWIGLGLRVELLYALTQEPPESLVTSPVKRFFLERLGAAS